MDPTPSNIEHIYSLLPSIIASMPSPDQVTHRNIRFGLASKLNLARVSFEGKGEDGWANVIRKEVMRLLEEVPATPQRVPSPKTAKKEEKEEDAEVPARSSTSPIARTESSVPLSPAKRRKLKKKRVPGSDEDSEEEEEGSVQTKRKIVKQAVESVEEEEKDVKPRSNQPVASSSKPTVFGKQEGEEEDAGNVSEYSSLIDEELKPKKANKKSAKPAPKPKTSSSKSFSASLSKDEASVANLKKIVVGCGMRKQWKKEFAGFEEDYKRQVRHLKGILSSFGIEGTPTLAKAKRRKEEVEEAEELADIQRGAVNHGLDLASAAVSSPKRRILVGRSGAKAAGSESEEEKTPMKGKKKRPIATVISDDGDEESD